MNWIVLVQSEIATSSTTDKQYFYSNASISNFRSQQITMTGMRLAEILKDLYETTDKADRVLQLCLSLYAVFSFKHGEREFDLSCLTR